MHNRTQWRKAQIAPMLCALLAIASAARIRVPKCSVLDHGAKGDGIALDSVAIASAIAGCDHVVFPGEDGQQYLTGTITLRSNLLLEVMGTILGAKGNISNPIGTNPFATAPTPFEPGTLKNGSKDPACPWGAHCRGYQDFGHSYWVDSLLHGKGVHNVTVMGNGTISGNGAILEGAPSSFIGQGTKLVGLVDSQDVTFTGSLTMTSGGWFTILATNCEHLTLSGITIRAARDALDIMGCRHVFMEHMHISGGGDDAVKFGGDWSRGKWLNSYNISVVNSVVGSNQCNALQFGSETFGNFSDFLFENITITKAGKAGIGMASMDGAHIHRLVFRNITMVDIVNPIFMYIGARLRGPLAKPGPRRSPVDSLVGAIYDIVIEDVEIADVGVGKGSGPKANHTSSIEGQPEDPTNGVLLAHFIGPNITISRVTAISSGGGGAKDVKDIPNHQTLSPWPRTLGTRPSYGLFMRRAHDVTFTDFAMSFNTSHPDGRPAVILSDVANVVFKDVTAAPAVPKLAYDIGLRGDCTGVDTSGSSALAVQNITTGLRFV